MPRLAALPRLDLPSAVGATIRTSDDLLLSSPSHQPHSDMAQPQGMMSGISHMQAYMGCCHVEGQTMLITEYMDEGDFWAALARPDSEYTWHRRYSTESLFAHWHKRGCQHNLIVGFGPGFIA